MHFAIERDVPRNPREQRGCGIEFRLVAGDYDGLSGLGVKNTDGRTEKDEEKGYNTE
jgi:hypothetical protein